MGSQQVSAGAVHGVEIQHGITALPGISPHERVFVPMDEVGVFPLPGAETGMEIRGGFLHLKNGHSAGQNGI